MHPVNGAFKNTSYCEEDERDSLFPQVITENAFLGIKTHNEKDLCHLIVACISHRKDF